MQRYIFTGMPGSGKTTIINKLADMGYAVISEAATDIIVREQANNNQAPWQDAFFIEQITHLQQSRQQSNSSFDLANCQFFDRSVFCTYALCKYLDFALPKMLLEEIKRIRENNIYVKEVFFIENLGHCQKSNVRQISFADALIFEQLHEDVYTSFGYTLIQIPALPIESRVNLVLSYLEK